MSEEAEEDCNQERGVEGLHSSNDGLMVLPTYMMGMSHLADAQKKTYAAVKVGIHLKFGAYAHFGVGTVGSTA